MLGLLNDRIPALCDDGALTGNQLALVIAIVMAANLLLSMLFTEGGDR